MSITSSMNIAQEALSVSQAAITTVSNNIANVDTPGYSKLRVNQSSVVNVSSLKGDSPTLEADSLSGVQLDNIQRYSADGTQSYYWQENSANSYLTEYSNVASDIQDLTNELNNTGLNNALSNFYTAAGTLNQNASDITARQNFVSAAQNVCSQFNSMSKSLSNVQTSLVGDMVSNSSSEIVSEIDNANSILDQLAEVNSDIIKTNTGTSSTPSLLDQRDQLVTKLTNLIPVTTQINSNGTITVSLGDYHLVNGGSLDGHLQATNSLDSATPPNLVTTVSIVDPSSNTTKVANINSAITGGSIGAVLDAAGTDPNKLNVSGVLGELNTMASQFASIMNTIQTDASGTTTPMYMSSATTLAVSTTNMFVNNTQPAVTETTGINAANIAVKSTVVNNPYLVAAARVNTVDVATSTNAVGNNSNSTLIVNTQTKTYAGLGNTTLSGYLSNMVAEVGTDVSNINTNSKNQTLVLQQIQTKLSAATGVNLDEELTDLIKYQRSYQSAARIFTTCNDLLDTLINLGK